jgi:hypothetical protein
MCLPRPRSPARLHGGDDTPTPAATTPPATTVTPAPPPPREPTRRLTLNIPERLHRAMKIKAATTGVTMVDEVRAVLEAHYSNAQGG